MSAELGDVVAGQYRLEELLGRGGMGAVYRATHVDLADSVALKLVELPPGHSLDDDPLFRKRFEREARVAFQLRHEHAVRVVDYGHDDGRPYMAMEYLEGDPLAAELEDRRPIEPLERAVRIARQLADVLEAMHDQSLVHRDLKPANVVMNPGDGDTHDRPVLVDFGLAYLADSDTLGRMTQAGETVGTPEYLAPEQGRGDRDIGPAADVYSFGCLFFEMLTGDVPFPDGSPTELIGKHLYVPAPGLLERADDTRAGELEPFVDLVADTLQKEPADRPDAGTIRDQLDRWASGDREWPRGRPPRFLQDRDERAIDEQEGASASQLSQDGATKASQLSQEGTTKASQLSPTVGVVGEIDEQWQLSLGTAGFDCHRLDAENPPADADDVDIVFLPDADPDRIRRWADTGAVLAGADPDDFDATTQLLDTPAADVVLRPVDASDLVDKVRRTWRKLQRREEDQ